MWVLLSFLSACADVPADAPAPAARDAAVSLAPPAPWYYYAMDEAIDWASLRFVGADVAFRTRGPGLQSGALEGAEVWAAALACGQATRATLLFEEGALARVATVPEAPCVEAAAWALGLADLRLGDVPVATTGQAVVALDVPEAPCSHCS